jgi:hypothetical protein
LAARKTVNATGRSLITRQARCVTQHTFNKRRQTIQDKEKEKESSTTKEKLDDIFLEIEHFFSQCRNQQRNLSEVTRNWQHEMALAARTPSHLIIFDMYPFSQLYSIKFHFVFFFTI